ncbi:hypothetical protein ACQP1K_21005 [Sphaerimonospora sp. CA-214678]|uniref:hypothetical protein n=1 Tax=Sphaerimonospora sp. CA-214678 TaxID=3240029 RepID=UPI003D8CF65B
MSGPHGGREDGTAPARCPEADRRCRGERAPDEVRAPDARRHEALGRVMATLADETEMLEACRDLAWWRGADHSWHVEWRDGPRAAEVAELLVERITGPEHAVPLAGLTGPATASTATLDVIGVSFALLAIDPVGMDRLRARPGLWRLSAALDGVTGNGGGTGSRAAGRSRGGGARRCWEELLGG